LAKIALARCVLQRVAQHLREIFEPFAVLMRHSHSGVFAPQEAAMHLPAKQIVHFLRAGRWPVFIAAAVALNAAIVIQVLGDDPAPKPPADDAARQQAALDETADQPQRATAELALQLPPGQLPTLKNLPAQIPEAAPALAEAPPAPVVANATTRLFAQEEEPQRDRADAVAIVKQAVERLAYEIDVLSAELERLAPGDQPADYAQTRLTAITSALQDELGDVVREDLSDQQRQELESAAEAKLMPAIERFAAASGRLSPPEPPEGERGEFAKVDREPVAPLVQAPESIDDEADPQAMDSPGQPELVIK